MDKYDYLKIMIENRSFDDDETDNLEKFGDAYDEYFDLVSNQIDREEFLLLVDTFSNKDKYDFFSESIRDLLFFYVRDTDEPVEFVIRSLLKNEDGFFDSIEIISHVVNELPRYKKEIFKQVLNLNVYSLINIVKLNKYSSKYYLNEELLFDINKKILNKFNWIHKFEYKLARFLDNINIVLNNNDVCILKKLQGIDMYYEKDEFIEILWDEKREELNKELNIKEINLIAEIKDHYLIEKDGFYYIRHRDQLNEDVYDVSVGNSLEKVLESVNLFSWIK